MIFAAWGTIGFLVFTCIVLDIIILQRISNIEHILIEDVLDPMPGEEAVSEVDLAIDLNRRLTLLQNSKFSNLSHLNRHK